MARKVRAAEAAEIQTTVVRAAKHISGPPPGVPPEDAGPRLAPPAAAAGDDLGAWTIKFRDARDERLALEREAKEIKEGPEAEAEAKILEILALRGQESARLAGGLGTVARMTRETLIIKDARLAVEAMHRSMTELAARGLPLTNALIFTRSLAKNAVLEWCRDHITAAGGNPDDYKTRQETLALIGVSAHQHETLSYTKGKQGATDD
jgi:hypothetical protein